jgi:hypothetical protein
MKQLKEPEFILGISANLLNAVAALHLRMSGVATILYENRNMKTLLIITVFTAALVSAAVGQHAMSVQKNFVSAFAGLEWNTATGMTGFDYERIIVADKKATAGFKVSYALPYQNGNMQLFNLPCCGVSSVSTVLATAMLFTSAKNDLTGFFLNGGLGVGLKTYYIPEILKRTAVRPALELGLGLQFSIGSRIKCRWTNYLTFPSTEGGITSSKLSFGF